MSEMVERVARAICFKATVMCQGRLCELAGKCTSPYAWHEHRDEARAAIEAMLEPTEEMVNATDCGFGLGDWKAMVRAALKEEP